MTTIEPRAMVCMEVAGGNVAYEGGLTLPGLEAWVITRPYEGQTGGGDVHYVSSCASGRITRMLVADVSGHGEHVAETSTALRDIMRKYVNYVDQTAVVRAINTAFSSVAAGRFATAVVATYWEPTSRLILCNAGHPRPIRRLARDASWSTLSLKAAASSPSRGGSHDIANLPLGIEELTRYEQFGTRLRIGDAVLLYTDALLEAASPNARQLGEQGLLDLLAGRSIDNPTHFLRILLSDISDWAGGCLPDDATAMLIIRTPTRTSFLSGLAAPLRIARAALTRRRGKPVGWPERRIDNLLGTFLPWLNGPRSKQ